MAAFFGEEWPPAGPLLPSQLVSWYRSHWELIGWEAVRALQIVSRRRLRSRISKKSLPKRRHRTI